MTANYVTGADLLGTWIADVETGTPPARFITAEPFAGLDIRPGRLYLFGGAPGGGKTAALLQIGVELLRLNEGARLLVANVEMTPALLLERIVSRIAAVPIKAISDRTMTPDQLGRIRAAVAALEPLAGRLAFLNSPYSLEHLEQSADAFGANVFIVDYLQRFTVDSKAEKREQLEVMATKLRAYCDEGAAVLCAAAVARQKSGHGSTYSGLGLASFRGSSELEYSCDSAYMLAPNDAGGITLTCEKNRYGGTADIVTRFDPAIQTFAAAQPPPSGLEGFDEVTPAPPPRGRKPSG